MRRLQTQIDEVDAELGELTQAEVAAAALDLRADLLDSGDEVTQRRIIGALIQEVIVYPVGRGVRRERHPFPESWDVWWKDAARPTRPGMANSSARWEAAARRNPKSGN